MFATPDGRLSKYISGIEYTPRDLRFALLDASQKKISNAVDLLLIYCCSYNPVVGKYSVGILSRREYRRNGNPCGCRRAPDVDDAPNRKPSYDLIDHFSRTQISLADELSLLPDDERSASCLIN
ncbi:hypothetical protein [Edaphobacter bradus]|uniref:hypothetical protein n=1 Tax=Edaphobacter bradus TaxID=2259016 RepID=UPI0021DF575C|nr:hypothetical protein [Edaphobacter bradus]